MTGRVLFILTFPALFISAFGQQQNRLDSLRGRWQIVQYYSPAKKSDIRSWEPGGCENFLTMDFNQKKVRLVFTDRRDSVVFPGKFKLKNKKLRIRSRIHGIVYLGELEKCIPGPLREDISRALYRTYDFHIDGNKLTLFYDFPGDRTKTEKMVFSRVPGPKP